MNVHHGDKVRARQLLKGDEGCVPRAEAVATVVAVLRGMVQAYWDDHAKPAEQPQAIKDALAALTAPDGTCSWPCPRCGAQQSDEAQDMKYSPRTCVNVVWGFPEKKGMCPMTYSATVAG